MLWTDVIKPILSGHITSAVQMGCGQSTIEKEADMWFG